MLSLNVHIGTIDDVLSINQTIEEFPLKFSREHFQNYLSHKSNSYIVVCYHQSKPVGFQIAYEEPNSLVLWCADVKKDYRRLGIMTRLTKFTENIAIKLSKNKIITDVSNRRPPIIHFFIKNGYLIYNFTKHDDILDNKIFLVKKLSV